MGRTKNRNTFPYNIKFSTIPHFTTTVKHNWYSKSEHYEQCKDRFYGRAVVSDWDCSCVPAKVATKCIQFYVKGNTVRLTIQGKCDQNCTVNVALKVRIELMEGIL